MSICKASQIEGSFALQPPAPEEDAALSPAASLKRVSEFRAGRACARHALARMACQIESIEADEAGCPSWPRGLVGSITHTENWAAAAVGHSSYCQSIGIDAELIPRLTRSLWKLVFSPSELVRVLEFPEEKQNALAAIMFSAKESFYKAQYTLTRRKMEFTDVQINLVETDSLSGEFSVETRFSETDSRLSTRTLSGRFGTYGDLVITSLMILA